MAERPSFDDFLVTKNWPDWLKDRARRVVRLAMMRGLPSMSEEEWDRWADSERKNDG